MQKLTLAAALVALLGLTSCDGRPAESREVLPVSSSSESLQGFEPIEVHHRRASTFHTLRRGDEVLKIEVVHGVDRDSARTLRDDGILALEALHASALSPYPGDISRKIEIAERFRPRLVREEADGEEIAHFLLFANERFGYGVATQDAIRYRALLGWRYCAESRRFVKVRYFAPPETADERLTEFFRGLRCRR